jgi:hypothetical protein
MLRYYYINKEWILSPTARRIYRISAALSLMLFLILWAVRMHVPIPSGSLPVLRALVFLGVVGAATTMVAMEYFFFGFDNASIWKKAFWFFVLLAPPLGPPLYCFIVYSKSNMLLPDPSLVRRGLD